MYCRLIFHFLNFHVLLEFLFSLITHNVNTSFFTVDSIIFTNGKSSFPESLTVEIIPTKVMLFTMVELINELGIIYSSSVPLSTHKSDEPGVFLYVLLKSLT